MADKKKILIQLDTDSRPSVFDAVVGVDSGADVLLPYGGVQPEEVQDLVHGAIFTRGAGSLRSTAIFIGGSDVELGERILAEARASFIGPLKVSLLLDSRGANTTAAAAVLAAGQTLGGKAPLAGRRALVLGSTGPVGRRVVRLLARDGAAVRAGSRSEERAAEVAGRVRDAVGDATVEPVVTGGDGALETALEGVELVVAAGGAGVTLLPRDARRGAGSLRCAIDLNAVPPAGIEGVEAMDAGKDRDGAACWGAIGVGGIKMKIHRAAVAELFESNDRVFDAEEILEIGHRVA